MPCVALKQHEAFLFSRAESVIARSQHIPASVRETRALCITPIASWVSLFAQPSLQELFHRLSGQSYADHESVTFLH